MRKVCMNRKRVVLAVLMVAILLSTPVILTCGPKIEDRSEKTFEAKPGGNLMLNADFGSVTIDSWGQNKIHVTVAKSTDKYGENRAQELFDEYRVSYKKTGDGVEILGEFPEMIRHRHFRVHFEIKVPEEFNLDLATSGGSIAVGNLKGEIELKTSGGSIKLGNITGNVNARTSGGSMSLNGADGTVNLKTSGGSISIGETSGKIHAETSGGSIRLDGSGGDVYAHTSGGSLKLKNIKGNIDASTSGGSIRAELNEQISEDCRLKTSGGGIKVYLTPDMAADIEATTSGGRVKCEIPLTVQSLKKSNKIKGQINGGGPLLKLRTSGGGIKIYKL